MPQSDKSGTTGRSGKSGKSGTAGKSDTMEPLDPFASEPPRSMYGSGRSGFEYCRLQSGRERAVESSKLRKGKRGQKYTPEERAKRIEYLRRAGASGGATLKGIPKTVDDIHLSPRQAELLCAMRELDLEQPRAPFLSQLGQALFPGGQSRDWFVLYTLRALAKRGLVAHVEGKRYDPTETRRVVWRLTDLGRVRADRLRSSRETEDASIQVEDYRRTPAALAAARGEIYVEDAEDEPDS